MRRTIMADAQAAAYLRSHHDDFLNRYFEFLRIPDQSALGAHRADMLRAAEWVAGALRTAGCPTVEILPTPGNPVVYGEWLVGPDRPTALVYGHYDVQPADPLELWESPPFEPTVRDGRIYARGAADDKRLYCAVMALEAVARTSGRPACNLKFMFEGEEEIGSPSLPGFLREHRARLACDVVLSADGSMFDWERPSLTLAYKGIASCQIDVRGARVDLHSGQHGGGVANPLHALAAILASMHGEDGRITVAGFYDDVRPLTAAEKADIAAVPFDEEAYRRDLQVPALFGEAGYTTLERQWARPTLEVNGMWGGFQGDGSKTVLPREAHAKITCRLVANQDPDRILDLLEAHLRTHTPAGVTASLQRFPGKAKPYMMPRELREVKIAAEVLEGIYGVPPLYTRAGGTLPVTEMVRDVLGVWTVGLAAKGENVHAPNEFFLLKDLERGARIFADYWQAYGEGAGR
jgi:acetylornithine deacetylase/succinyl-diaminopimelate desuccinylase-like protein